jgi:choline kinase
MKYAQSMVLTQKFFTEKDYQLSFDTTENESLINRARNISAARFFKSDCDVFIFIDADIHFDPESLARLIESPYEVSVGTYPKKCIMWDRAANAVANNTKVSLSTVASSLALNFTKSNQPIENGFTEILDGATGFMCIKRSALEKMYEHYTDLMCKNDHEYSDIKEYCAIFECMIDPDTKRYLSEDYAFCRRWQALGGKIYTDLLTTLGHVGSIRFTGKLKG